MQVHLWQMTVLMLCNLRTHKQTLDGMQFVNRPHQRPLFAWQGVVELWNLTAISLFSISVQRHITIDELNLFQVCKCEYLVPPWHFVNLPGNISLYSDNIKHGRVMRSADIILMHMEVRAWVRSKPIVLLYKERHGHRKVTKLPISDECVNTQGSC